MVSEVCKRASDARVTAWFAEAASSDLFVSVLVVGEIRQGIERLRARDPGQSEVFERWLETLRGDFGDRILPVSAEVADAWGRLNALAPLPTVDSLLAATALVHGLTLVTRDISKLRATGVPLLDPWQPLTLPSEISRFPAAAFRRAALSGHGPSPRPRTGLTW